MPFGTLELLQLEDIKNELDFLNWIENNFASYRESYKAFYEYFQLILAQDKDEFITKLKENKELHSDVVESIEKHSIMETF